MVKLIIKPVCAVLFIILMFSFGISLGGVIGEIQSINQYEVMFAAAFVAGIFIFGKGFPVFNVWLHEHNHLLVSLMFGKRIHDIRVTRTAGGYIEHLGSNNFVVSLSPYAIPLFALIVLCTQYVLAGSFLWIPFILGGILYGQHIAAALRDTRSSQPDISEHGTLFSFSFVMFSNIVFFGIVLILITMPAPLKPMLNFIWNGIVSIGKLWEWVGAMKR